MTPADLSARLRELLEGPHDAMDYMRFVLTNQTTIIRLLESMDGVETALERLQRTSRHKDDYCADWQEADALATSALATLRAAREGAR